MRPPFSRLEAQLERLIEGAFAQLFSKTLRPHDIAVQLSRAMEDGVRRSDDGDLRPVAPNRYYIRLHPTICHHLLTRQPDLPLVLCQHVGELAAFAGYRLLAPPAIHFQPDTALEVNVVQVTAEAALLRQSTAVMQPIQDPTPETTPQHPTYLIINGQQTISLTTPLLTVGRGLSSDLVLDDPHVSRQHAQFRLRLGSYTLFDTNSQSGTFINEVMIREHVLSSGDVIRIGKGFSVPANGSIGTLTISPRWIPWSS